MNAGLHSNIEMQPVSQPGLLDFQVIADQFDLLLQRHGLGFGAPPGTETGQGAVGLVIDDEYLEIHFPLKN